MVNPQSKKTFEQLCIPERLERTDYMSDSYAAVLTINDIKTLSQITHIKLPFDKEREKAVMEYYDISKDSMKSLYGSIGVFLTNQVRICSYLRNKGVSSILTYVKRATFETQGKGNEVYLVTEHLRPVCDVYFNGTTSLTNIFNFGVRTAKLIKDVHQMGENPVTIRVIDPEQIFVADDGKFVFGCFQYAHMAGSKNPPIPITETSPLHIDGKVTTGSIGDIGTDMYSLASILWSLLNGDGFDKPTPTGTPPKYATPEMVSVLELGLAGDPEMFPQFRKRLGEIFRAVKAEDNPLEIPVPAAPRCINTPTYTFDIGTVAEVEVPVAEDHTSPVEATLLPIMPTPTEEPRATEELEGSAESVVPVQPEAAEDKTPEIIEVAEPVVEVIEPIEPEQEPEEDVAASVPAAEPVTAPITYSEESEEDFGTFKASVLDTAEFVENTDSAAEIEADSIDSGMDFEFVYHKPVFFFRQLFVAAIILAVFAAILYMSVKMHLISLW